MSLAGFIDETLALDDPGELFTSYLGALREYGVDRVAYCALRNGPAGASIFPAISHCYPEDWVKYYVANDYQYDDPVRQCALERSAFTWDHMIQSRDLTDRQMLIMNQGEDAGLLDGVGVPLHGPMGEVYGVGMASSVANPDVGRHLKELQVLSTQFHVLYAGMYDQTRHGSDVILTPRESEVLKWCAAGKSNWTIGEILSISEHGVDFHVRNILRKLETDNRITAVVKALRAGLLNL